jgi:hypothetical protein
VRLARITGFEIVQPQTELVGLGACGSSALTGGIGGFLQDRTITEDEVNNRAWSACASRHFCLSRGKAFFGRPLWPSGNDHGDA